MGKGPLRGPRGMGPRYGDIVVGLRCLASYGNSLLPRGPCFGGCIDSLAYF